MMLAHERQNVSEAVNPLQRVIADAMADAGMPLERRGSKAELARRAAQAMPGRASRAERDQRARTLATIVTYTFTRDNYLPDERHRAAIAAALGIPRSVLDDAGAQIKGLRVQSTGPGVLRALDEVRSSFAIAVDELTEADLAAARRALDEIARQITERLKGGTE